MAIAFTELTTGTLDGTGVFDMMTRSIKAHLLEEHTQGRIKGAEYATVYLGALSGAMDRSLEFLLQREKIELEADLIRAQILKVNQEILLVGAQIALAEQQAANLLLEGELIPEQKNKLIAETSLLGKQELKVVSETVLLGNQNLKVISETELVDQQVLNAAEELLVLTAQRCKLQAEFDLLVENKLKTVGETSLLAQRKITEQAQTSGDAIDPNSVLGKQNTLYTRQAEGFLRDAEQKAASILADAWKVRRSTDESTPPNSDNMMDDFAIGRAMSVLLSGVNA